jgi:hypothetical protein
LAEPEGRADERGPAETSAVPEGAVRVAAGAAQRESLQALRGKPHPASDLESLDMHAGLDEPELLMRLLTTIAAEHSHARREWRIVFDHAQGCVEALEKANETPRR